MRFSGCDCPEHRKRIRVRSRFWIGLLTIAMVLLGYAAFAQVLSSLFK